MTNAFEIRRASPGHLLKSGCGVPPPVLTLFISAFQLSEFQLLPHSAITQVRTLLSACSVKRLK